MSCSRWTKPCTSNELLLVAGEVLLNLCSGPIANVGRERSRCSFSNSAASMVCDVLIMIPDEVLAFSESIATKSKSSSRSLPTSIMSRTLRGVSSSTGSSSCHSDQIITKLYIHTSVKLGIHASILIFFL